MSAGVFTSYPPPFGLIDNLCYTARPGIPRTLTEGTGYTVICEFENYNNQFLYYIGFEDRAVYSPPELEDNNPHLWKNQVGTGPFMFESYTIGSSMTFKKNPNYWYKTTIDGKEYQLPFIDRLIFPIIPDAATMMSAVRTGDRI